jgi:hypothetical protein
MELLAVAEGHCREPMLQLLALGVFIRESPWVRGEWERLEAVVNSKSTLGSVAKRVRR